MPGFCIPRIVQSGGEMPGSRCGEQNLGSGAEIASLPGAAIWLIIEKLLS